MEFLAPLWATATRKIEFLLTPSSEPLQVTSLLIASAPLCTLHLAIFSFFTLSAVLDFLSQLPGWHAGLVRCSGVALRGSDGRVCGFEQDGESVWEEEEDAVIEVDASEVRANPQFPVMVN